MHKNAKKYADSKLTKKKKKKNTKQSEDLNTKHDAQKKQKGKKSQGWNKFFPKANENKGPKVSPNTNATNDNLINGTPFQNAVHHALTDENSNFNRDQDKIETNSFNREYPLKGLFEHPTSINGTDSFHSNHTDVSTEATDSSSSKFHNKRDFNEVSEILEQQQLTQDTMRTSNTQQYNESSANSNISEQPVSINFAESFHQDLSLASTQATDLSSLYYRNQRDFEKVNDYLEKQHLSKCAGWLSDASQHINSSIKNNTHEHSHLNKHSASAQATCSSNLNFQSKFRNPSDVNRFLDQQHLLQEIGISDTSQHNEPVAVRKEKASSFSGSQTENSPEPYLNEPNSTPRIRTFSEKKADFLKSKGNSNQRPEYDFEKKLTSIPSTQTPAITQNYTNQNSVGKDRENISHEFESIDSETDNIKIDKELKKPPITAEQLNNYSSPNSPLDDLNKFEQLSRTKRSSETFTEDSNSDSKENSTSKKNSLTDSQGHVSDEVFFDAPEDISINQRIMHSNNNNIAKIGFEPYVTNAKAKWNIPNKKASAPDSNKLFCSDKKQYIKKKFQNGNLYYSAKFLSHHSYLVAQGEVSYEILGERNLLIADSDNFIARIEVTPGDELDFTKSFRQNKATLVGRVTIVKVLEDDLLVQRNEAYNLLKKILEARSENISDFQDYAEDFLQISIMLKTYQFYSGRPHLLLQEIIKNQFISEELKITMEHLFNFETSLQKRNRLFPKFVCPSYSSLQDLFSSIQLIRKNALRIHKQNLIKKCSTQNSYLLCRILEINKLPVEKLLRITNDDIKLFTDLMTLTNEESKTATSIIPLEFVDNLWSHFYCKLLSENCKSLKDSGPLSHSIYFFLVKSLRDLIIDIVGKSTTTARELFKKERGDFVITKNISWSLNCSANVSSEKQYKLIYKLMRHFEPGSYSSEKKFLYKFALLEGVDDSTFWRTIKGLVIKNKNDIFNMPEERLVWLYIVDAGIAPIIHDESNSRFKKLSIALLTGFLKFVQKTKHVQYETFRIAAHNIVKFAAQILPYFKVMNSISQDLDHSILDKQIHFINSILSSDEGDIISNLFSSLMEVYNEYWELRESIIGKFPIPCGIFEGLVNEMMLKILEIVDNTLSKQVELQLIIQYFRLFNEFVKHFKGINFAWFISKTTYLNDIKEYVKEIKKGDKITYEVLDSEKLIEILREKDKDIPKHFLLETILELLKVINKSLNKSDWSDESRLKAAGDLFLAIGHSFAHFEDQTDYTDIELFLRDCTTPFKSVIENSQTYSEFKIRLDNVENYYLYARKQNQIGIQRALDLCIKEVKKAQENGFLTIINRDILEECFNKYSEKLALLQNLDIPAILEDLSEQLKNVEVLPFEQWTPPFKQTILPVLLADLAAIWTIIESKDVAVIQKRIEPHCIQIICVLRLIGADHLENGVPKHFAQVLTGQGKSIILGLLSSLIALTGHKANIVCYSKYLAARDQNAFNAFFRTLDRFTRDNKITYYTFDNMAEDALTRNINGRKVNLRTVVNEVVLNKIQDKTIETVENPADSILLIDEVDVFFSETFYGLTYNPCSTIGMAALREIQPKLWEIVEGGVYDKSSVLEKIRESINELLKDEKYEDFKNFVSCTSTLFEENLDKMVTTAITVSRGKNDPDEWFVKKFKIDYNGLISYRERLGFYCTNTYMGYYNVFNYFRLKESNYDDKNFQNYGYFSVIWGHISYANLPLSYRNILGVSGTLMTLNEHEKNAIKKYGIETMSAMPSFFGERKLAFDPSENLTIQDSVNNWHSKIFDHISRTIQAHRAVLVFFDTDSEITKFADNYRNNINRLNTLTGDERPEKMEWIINEAGVDQTVTLATRAMGRGIDYKSNDGGVEENGGVHVIQTFFSLDEKEETQIKGRTARKDNKGSYEMILCRIHLKEIGCNEKSDGNPVTTYQELREARILKANSKGATIEAKIHQSEEAHNLTMTFLNSLTNYTPEQRKEFFSKYPFTKPEL